MMKSAILGHMMGAATGLLLAVAPAFADEATNLATFDTLDFDVFSGQHWDRFGESHAPDIAVFSADGSSTTGLDVHIGQVKWLFSWAPDTAIKEHPIRIAEGEWTAVVGVMTGTFTQPMMMMDGSVIEPTGKAYRIELVTVAHWNADGLMDQERLYMDNAALMRQLGVGM